MCFAFGWSFRCAFQISDPCRLTSSSQNSKAMVSFAREAREEVLVAKAQCEERQRVLDEMSRELQESGWDGTPILDDPIRHDCD